jgi:hypothetical protein
MPLVCEPHIAEADLPRLPLFPGQSQHWSLALRQTGPDVEARVIQILRTWLPLFGGPVSEPRIAGTEDLPGAVDRLPPLAGVEPPAIEVRDPATLISVRFDYLGPATSMRWPTFVQRRRERVDPLCPMRIVDATPVAVGRALPLLRNALIEPLPPVADDPLDAGLGPVDPGKLAGIFAVGGLAVGVGVAFLLLSRWKR